MGCSYDPVPYDWTPSPGDLWLKDNHFSRVRVGDRTTGMTCCMECGTVIFGNKQGTNFLVKHLRKCPESPRGEVPLKTEEECKQFTETRFR